jgi:hypothetical protein
MDPLLKFDLLALDIDEESPIKSEINMLHSLLGNGTLWKHPRLDDAHARISDEGLTLTVQSVVGDPDLKMVLHRAFLIKINGRFSEVEPLRKPLAEYLRKQSFELLYILTDEISERIACKIYPLIYKVENLLRAYLIKFMTMRLGPHWWEITATNDFKNKVQQRKDNEQVFAQHIVNKTYLIDFRDLGQIIYAHSSGFKSKEDIIKSISLIDETPEAIRTLKEQLQSNYQKFFKETFKDKGFQAKWELLEKIRHKVAHNNLFTAADEAQAKSIADELSTIIKEAMSKVDAVTLAAEEKEAIKESLVDQDFLTEDEFIDELRAAELYFAKNNGFVGLKHFVQTYLGDKGFDYRVSYDLVSRLEKEGKVEIYPVDNPREGYPPTSAIRIANGFET